MLGLARMLVLGVRSLCPGYEDVGVSGTRVVYLCRVGGCSVGTSRVTRGV